MASMIPGMQYMLERMQAELDVMRARLTAAQAVEARGVNAPRLGRPPGKRGPGGPARSGWSNMTAEERKVEMRRRMALAAQKRNGTARAAVNELNGKPARKLVPRDLAHPDHDKWAKKQSRRMKAKWAGYTPAERQARVQAAAAGAKAGKS
jgi:hypothetical protein